MTYKELNITPSLEDYLEAILTLTGDGESVRVTDVAKRMGISKPSVNKAINNLKIMELVSHEHYGLLRLTKKGRDIALNVSKRHMILKSFLLSCLVVDEETAEREACLMEHSMSADTVEKLEGFLSQYRLMLEKDKSNS